MRPGRIDSRVGQATRCGSGFCRRSIGAFRRRGGGTSPWRRRAACSRRAVAFPKRGVRRDPGATRGPPHGGRRGGSGRDGACDPKARCRGGVGLGLRRRPRPGQRALECSAQARPKRRRRVPSRRCSRRASRGVVRRCWTGGDRGGDSLDPRRAFDLRRMVGATDVRRRTCRKLRRRTRPRTTSSAPGTLSRGTPYGTIPVDSARLGSTRARVVVPCQRRHSLRRIGRRRLGQCACRPTGRLRRNGGVLGRVGDLADDLDDVAVRVEDAQLAVGAVAAARGSRGSPRARARSRARARAARSRAASAG